MHIWLLGLMLSAGAGVGSLDPQQVSCTSNIVVGEIRIDNVPSQPEQLVGDTMAIRATVTSACQLQSVVADAFGHSVALSFASGFWTGNFSLASDPHTAFTLTVTATDINAKVATGTRSLIHDTKPTLTLTQPVHSAVARPSLPVVVSCADDDPTGCFSLTVAVVDGPTLASGTSQLNLSVSLASFEGQQRVLRFTGTDVRGQPVVAQRTVYVESNTRLVEVAATDGAIVDDSPARTLFLTNDVDPSVLEKSTGVIVPLTTSFGSYGRVTNRGAIVVATPPASTTSIVELQDGVLSTLASPNGSESLHVAGNFAIWSAGPPAEVSLFRRDLQAGTTLTVAEHPVVTGIGNTENDVASNGDVVYWRTLSPTVQEIYRYRDGITTQLTTSGALSVYPTTDGVNVAYRHKTVQATGWETRLITSGGDSMLADFSGFSGFSPAPTEDYATNNGWTAFTKPFNGAINVWRRAPDGTISQVSFFGTSSTIDALNSDGAVTVRNANRLWLFAANGASTEVSLAIVPFTRSFWRSGELHVIIGASVFKLTEAPAITGQPANQTATFGQTVTFTVTASGTAPLSYQWYTGTSGTTTSPIPGATSSSYTTPPVSGPLTSPTHYWVRVSNALGSADSTTATTTIAFTDDPLVAGSTMIKGVHVIELRSRIDAVRGQYGLSPFSYTEPSIAAGATLVRAQHILEARTALAQAYVAAGASPATYSTSPAAGVTIVVADLASLRAAVVAIE